MVKQITTIVKTWFVYIIQSQKDGTLYTGISTNVEKRLKAHNENKGARYTKGRGPFKLLKSVKCNNKSEAARLEYKIKQFSKEEKIKYASQ